MNGNSNQKPRRFGALLVGAFLVMASSCAQSSGGTPFAFSDGSLDTEHVADAAPGDPDVTLPATDAGGGSDVGSDATASDVALVEAGQRCESACAGIGDCRLGICVIDCSGFNSCSTGMTCPAGVPCRVDCTDGGCEGPIDCGQASSCEINCGSSGCSDTLKCGGSECHVICGGTSSCAAEIDCTAQRCSIECSGTSSCDGKITCSGADCTVDCGGTSVCGGGVCCSATTCNVFPVTNTCP